jgi:thiol-disulfide isomerase/thioredoxin
MARRPRLVAPVLAAVVALATVVALGACGGKSGSGAGGTAGGLDALVEVKAADRKPAPALTGDLLDGSGRFDLSRSRGQVVVVNFWASWCAPCRLEAADLEAVHQATKAKGVAFLGIDVRDERDQALAFERGRTSYPSVFDPAGRLALDFDLPPSTIPATLVIDRDGRLAVVIRTAVRQAQLQPIVERLAAENADG